MLNKEAPGRQIDDLLLSFIGAPCETESETLFEELECFARQVGRRAIVVVQNAREHVDQVNADTNAAALL